MNKVVRAIRSRTVMVVGSGLLLTGLVGGVSLAAIPNSSTKQISACYSASGALRVIDKQAGAACASGETLLEWNQKGPIGMRWLGAWSSATAYVKSDGVQYLGSAWIALASSTNVAPGSDASKWSLVASKGTRGAPGLPGPQGPAGTVYMSAVQRTGSGGFPATITFTNVPAGRALLHLELSAYATTSAGLGYVSTTLSPTGDWEHGVLYFPRLYFNQVGVHQTLNAATLVSTYTTAPGTLTITLDQGSGSTPLLIDNGDLINASLEVTSL